MMTRVPDKIFSFKQGALNIMAYSKANSYYRSTARLCGGQSAPHQSSFG